MKRVIKEKLQERISDSHLKKELETIQPEVEAVRAMIKARIEQGLTQKDLAQKVGMDQADISKLESGTRTPSLKLLKKLAEGLGMELRIHFEPKKSEK